jgi:uncharacterized protein YjiS (DUF1127 family)
MLDHPRTRPAATSAPHAAAPRWRNPARRIIAPLLHRRRRRAAIADLDRLCDRLLDDIGLSRNDIPVAVDALLERDPAADPRREAIVTASAQPREAARRAA